MLDGVSQLADVPGPRMRGERALRLVRQARRRTLHRCGQGADEVQRETRDVLAPLSQRRNPNLGRAEQRERIPPRRRAVTDRLVGVPAGRQRSSGRSQPGSGRAGRTERALGIILARVVSSGRGSSSISSRNSVPPAASASCPRSRPAAARSDVARRKPSCSSRGGTRSRKAGQPIETKGPSRRALRSCVIQASVVLPVPTSPRSRSGSSVVATRSSAPSTRSMAGLSENVSISGAAFCSRHSRFMNLWVRARSSYSAWEDIPRPTQCDGRANRKPGTSSSPARPGPAIRNPGCRRGLRCAMSIEGRRHPNSLLPWHPPCRADPFNGFRNDGGCRRGGDGLRRQRPRHHRPR